MDRFVSLGRLSIAGYGIRSNAIAWGPTRAIRTISRSAGTSPNPEPACRSGLPLQGRRGSVEDYDPAKDTWVTAPSLSVARADFGLARLPSGNVLATFGFGASTPGASEALNAEVYVPLSPIGAPCAAPSECLDVERNGRRRRRGRFR
jgi:hypothetical protein